MERYQKIGLAKDLDRVLPKAEIELSDEQIQKLRNMGEVILALVGVAGMLTVAAVAPNALQLIGKLPWARRTYRGQLSKKRDQKKTLARAFYYVRQTSYVQLIRRGNETFIKITAKGRKKIQRMNFQTLSVPKEKWRGSWWFVLADIPTQDHRADADRLRIKLRNMNFFPLQRRVWVYPFDPRDEVGFISAFYGIDHFVTVLQASSVDPDDEKKLKAYFKNLRLI